MLSTASLFAAAPAVRASQLVAAEKLGPSGESLRLSWADPIVETTAGMVRGYWNRGIFTFKGIPYGATTAGAGRFQAPRPTTPWMDVRDALRYGPVSPQPERSLADRY